MATVQSAPRSAPARSAPPRRALPETPALLGIALIGLVFGLFAAARWTGVLPFGSDNDEYQLVARALLDTGTPVIGGVEATKYPLGYPLVLAVILGLGLPLMAAVVLNFALVGATAALVALTLKDTHRGLGQLTAAAYVTVNDPLWGSTTSLMPDTLITFLSALLLYAVVRADSVRGVLAVTATSFAATMVKSVGVLLGGAASLFLLVAPPTKQLRRWFLLPGAAGVVALLIHALIVRPYPQATTGYGRVFFLTNPYDASQGRDGLAEVIARIWTRWDVPLGDISKAIISPHANLDVAMILAVVLLAIGIWGLGPRWAYGLGLVAIYGVGLTLWPFASVRFGLPMVPLAAVGVAQISALVARQPDRTVRLAGVAVVVMGLAAYGVYHFDKVAEGAEGETNTYSRLHANTAEAVHWANHNIAEQDVIASPAYRELTDRMGGRHILPVSYTRDPADLWEQTGERGADWFINLTQLYPRRARVGATLVRSYPERFEKVFENGDVAIYRIR